LTHAVQPRHFVHDVRLRRDFPQSDGLGVRFRRRLGQGEVACEKSLIKTFDVEP